MHFRIRWMPEQRGRMGRLGHTRKYYRVTAASGFSGRMVLGPVCCHCKMMAARLVDVIVVLAETS